MNRSTRWFAFVLVVVLFLVVVVAMPASAAPKFPTVEEVKQLIAQAVAPLQGSVSSLTIRVTALEAAVGSHSQVGPNRLLVPAGSIPVPTYSGKAEVAFRLINMDSGDVIYTFTTNSAASNSVKANLICDGTLAYFVTEHYDSQSNTSSQVFGLIDARTGQLLWNTAIPDVLGTGAGDDMLQVDCAGRRILVTKGQSFDRLIQAAYLLDMDTGQLIYRPSDSAAVGPGYFSAQLVCGNQAILVSYMVSLVPEQPSLKRMVLVRASDGHALWQQDFPYYDMDYDSANCSSVPAAS